MSLEQVGDNNARKQNSMRLILRGECRPRGLISPGVTVDPERFFSYVRSRVRLFDQARIICWSNRPKDSSSGAVCDEVVCHANQIGARSQVVPKDHPGRSLEDRGVFVLHSCLRLSSSRAIRVGRTVLMPSPLENPTSDQCLKGEG